jgi:tetratricopeptide (TPR) repeat protein
MYIPSLSLYLAIGYLLGLLGTTQTKRSLRYIGIASSVSFIAFLSLTAFNYTKYWKNDDVLWNRVIELYPEKAFTPYHNLGSIYALRNEIPKSIEYYNKALNINPTNFDTLHNLAKLYQRTGNSEKAAWYYKQLTATHPTTVKSYIINGDYLFSKKMTGDAKYNYYQALKLEPDNLIAIYKTALMDAINQNYSLAVKKLNLLLSVKRNNKEALRLLATIKANTGQLSEAKSIATTILKLDPNDKTARMILNNSGNHTAADSSNQ